MIGRTGIILCCAAIFAASPVSAKPWIVDYDHSRLGFTGWQGKEAFQGSFKSFQAVIDFDAAAPQQGKISATITTASASTGDKERDTYLPQAEWFNPKTFPDAKFTSQSIRATAGGGYIASGTLTIKDMTLPVDLPFTLKQDKDAWHATGKLTIRRSDYHVGIGDWGTEDYVKFPVEISVDLTAKPSP